MFVLVGNFQSFALCSSSPEVQHLSISLLFMTHFYFYYHYVLDLFSFGFLFHNYTKKLSCLFFLGISATFSPFVLGKKKEASLVAYCSRNLSERFQFWPSPRPVIVRIGFITSLFGKQLLLILPQTRCNFFRTKIYNHLRKVNLLKTA